MEGGEIGLAMPWTGIAPKRDTKQFRQACEAVGLSRKERYQASSDLHAEKQSVGRGRDKSYGELLDWLRQWKFSR